MSLTAEYLDLCRDLALPREWQHGDLAWSEELGLVAWVPMRMEALEGRGFEAIASTRMGEYVWRPREGNWLDLLAVEGVQRVLFSWVNDAGTDPLDVRGGRWIVLGAHIWQSESRDRCTALARLYQAVTACAEGHQKPESSS